MTKHEPRKLWNCADHISGQVPCPNCVPVSVKNIPGREYFGREEGFDAKNFLNGNAADVPHITHWEQDDVRSPAHYTVGGIETIDYMAAKATPDEFRGHLRLTALKYLSRAGHKDDALKDYRKARVYLDWLIRHLETGSHK